jgi:hypothetical protein
VNEIKAWHGSPNASGKCVGVQWRHLQDTQVYSHVENLNFLGILCFWGKVLGINLSQVIFGSFEGFNERIIWWDCIIKIKQNVQK